MRLEMRWGFQHSVSASSLPRPRSRRLASRAKPEAVTKMPKPKPAKDEQLGLKIDALLNVMRDLVILESAKGGLSRDQVRKMLGVSPARVSRSEEHTSELQSPCNLV